VAAGAEALIMPLVILDEEVRLRVFSLLYAELALGSSAALSVFEANSQSGGQQLLACFV
jgi:hypothetical protein